MSLWNRCGITDVESFIAYLIEWDIYFHNNANGDICYFGTRLRILRGHLEFEN